MKKMSKELECFKRIKKYSIIVDYEKDIVKSIEELLPNSCREVEQALLKAQEKEDKAKAFNLINNKNVDIKLLKWAYPSVEAYNVKVREQKDYWWREELTKEEFELLKRWLDEKN
jgi:hypothetical protein